MATLKFKEEQVFINGERALMKAGEFHYFRIKKELWEPGLEKLKKAGMNVIASYVPWVWHEYEENKFDFVGKTDPRRDLMDFIELVKEKGFLFMFRPGPYINAEYNGQGVPLWVGENYPEAIAKRPDGSLDGGPYWYTPTWNHPTYMKLVKKWYSAVFDAVREYIGDPIVSVQVDNEIGVPYINKIGVIDFNPVAISRFRNWLRKKYGTIEKLNAAWHTKYHDFEEILPPKKPIIPASATDWQMFLDDEGIEFITSLKKMVRELGVELPISINEPSIILAPMNPIKKADFADIYGYDIYLKMSTEKTPFDMTFGDSLMPAMFLAIKKKEHPLASLEFGAGWFNPRTYQHRCYFAQTLIASLAHGMKGMVLYVAHDCVEPTGHIYAYDSIIRHDGSIGYKYFQYTGIYNAIEKYKDEFLDSTLVTDGSAILFYYGNHYILPGEINKAGTMIPGKFRMKFGWAGFLAAEYIAGYRPWFVAIEREEDLSRYPVVIFPSLGFVEPRIYKKLLDYVKKGGILLTVPRVPTKDLHGNPLDTKELYPATLTGESWPGAKRIYLSIIKKMISYGLKGTIRKTIKEHPTSRHAVELMWALDAIFASKFKSREITYERGRVDADGYLSFWKGEKIKPLLTYKGRIVGYEADIEKGKSVVIGGGIGARMNFSVFYKTPESYLNRVAKFAKWLLSRVGINPVVKQDAPVEVILRETPASYLMFVINRGRARKVKITHGKQCKQPEILYRIFKSQIIRADENSLELDMNPNDSMILRLAK